MQTPVDNILVLIHLVNGPECAHTKHDQPLRILDTVLVRLGVPKGGDLNVVGLIDLLLSTVTDEDRLATPLDDNLLSYAVSITVATRYSGRRNTMRYRVTYVLALRDGTKADFDLSLGQDIRRGGHVNQEVWQEKLNQPICP